MHHCIKIVSDAEYFNHSELCVNVLLTMQEQHGPLFVFSFLQINSIHLFQALLAHQEELHIQKLVYFGHITEVGVGTPILVAASRQYAQNI
jgi:hypothetical protein